MWKRSRNSARALPAGGARRRAEPLTHSPASMGTTAPSVPRRPQRSRNSSRICSWTLMARRISCGGISRGTYCSGFSRRCGSSPGRSMIPAMLSPNLRSYGWRQAVHSAPQAVQKPSSETRFPITFDA